jgi:HlyD family secretion protein
MTPSAPGSTAAVASPSTTIARARHDGTRLALRVLGVALAAVVAALVARRLSHTQTTPLVRYQTSTVDRGPITAKVTASGALSAVVTVQVGSQVSGRIDHLYVDFNSPVKKGQPIATIEPSFFRAAKAQADANLAAARAAYDKAVANRGLADKTYARQQVLFSQNLVARADLDAAEAQALSSHADVGAAHAATLQAQAALDQATLNLGYTRIVSPIDGVVLSRAVDVGQTVAASFQAPTIFTIAQDLTKMQVDTNVAEGDVGKLREGMDATFTVDAYPERVFRGRVRQVRENATTLQNVVTYDAVIDVDNGDGSLRPTMTATASFVYANKMDAPRLPNAALRFRPDSATVTAMIGEAAPSVRPSAPDDRLVWILRSGRAEAHVVRIGIGDGMLTEIVSGDVGPGDTVVTEAVPQEGRRSL